MVLNSLTAHATAPQTKVTRERLLLISLKNHTVWCLKPKATGFFKKTKLKNSCKSHDKKTHWLNTHCDHASNTIEIRTLWKKNGLSIYLNCFSHESGFRILQNPGSGFCGIHTRDKRPTGQRANGPKLAVSEGDSASFGRFRAGDSASFGRFRAGDSRIVFFLAWLARLLPADSRVCCWLTRAFVAGQLAWPDSRACFLTRAALDLAVSLDDQGH